ncbi:unnamed protein product [Vitrella brassicaformis CCMP3155]|uniref:Uncharacterized protein n=1 Tax=Vitrella brassicaformis (strain CCMP3155) TaxID=1169540 RepID=A0A0G4GCG8_VITBC|nr:unnamed protein product [Vitrella brassicaformis CCMP3155]|eukprot:CEM26966.1 unnamed protein product [Vitrella brassicaformis CCMP3155]
MQQGFCTLMQLTHALSSSARVQLIEAERQVRQQQERLAHADLERRLAAVERQQAAWRDEQQTATIRQLQDSNAAMMQAKIDALEAQLVEGHTALAESEERVRTARPDVEALKAELAQQRISKTAAEAQLRERDGKLSRAQKDIEAFKAEMAGKQKWLTEAERTIKTLQAKQKGDEPPATFFVVLGLFGSLCVLSCGKVLACPAPFFPSLLDLASVVMSVLGLLCVSITEAAQQPGVGRRDC